MIDLHFPPQQSIIEVRPVQYYLLRARNWRNTALQTKGHLHERLAVFLILCGFLFLPFWLPISAVAWPLKTYLGWFYLLVHPHTLIVCGVFLQINKNTGQYWKRTGIYWIGISLLAMGVLLSALFSDARPDISIRYLWFGILGLAIAFWIFKKDEDKIFLRALCYGISGWAIVSLCVYLYSFHIFFSVFPSISESYQSLHWDGLILAMRSPRREILDIVRYDEFLGSMNKASNYGVLNILLINYLLAIHKISLKAAAFLYLPMLMLLIITFSRGAFLVCLGLAGLSLILIMLDNLKGKKSFVSKRFFLGLAVSLLSPFIVSVSTNRFRQHWIYLASITTRIEFWIELEQDIRQDPDATSKILMGLGPGQYGILRVGLPERSTHNLFLDVWLAGGILGISGFVIWMITAMYFANKGYFGSDDERRRLGGLFGLLGLTAIAGLGLREYALAYLYATSMGAVLLAVFGAMCAESMYTENDCV